MMISSMLLFFRRDCAEGAGPAVELASPALFDASLLVPPRVGAGWPVDADGCAVVVGVFAPPPPRLNKDVGAGAVLAPDAGGAELPPPPPENNDEVCAPVVGGAVVPPPVAAVEPGVEAAGVPPNSAEPPVDAGGFGAPPPPNKPEVGAAEDVGVAALPPKLKPPMLEGGCEVPVDAGVAPRPKLGALLAGVAFC